MNIGRSNIFLASPAQTTEVMNNTSPLVLPASSTCFFLGSISNNEVGNMAMHGYCLDSPGAGNYYYTLWMSSATPYNYSSMAVSLTALFIG
jgi:hypothetical protein